MACQVGTITRSKTTLAGKLASKLLNSDLHHMAPISDGNLCCDPPKKGKRSQVKIEFDIKDEKNDDDDYLASLGKANLSSNESIKDNITSVKVESDVKEDQIVIDQDVVKTSKKIAKTSRSTDDKFVKWEPRNWREQLTNIEAMRSQRDAPVDTMGCHKICDFTASPEVRSLSNIL